MLYLCGKLRNTEKEKKDHEKDIRERRKLSADEAELEKALRLRRQRSLSVPKSVTGHFAMDKAELARIHRSPSGRRTRASTPEGLIPFDLQSRHHQHLSVEHIHGSQLLLRRQSSLGRKSSTKGTSSSPKHATDSSHHEHGHLVTLATGESTKRRRSKNEHEMNGAGAGGPGHSDVPL